MIHELLYALLGFTGDVFKSDQFEPSESELQEGKPVSSSGLAPMKTISGYRVDPSFTLLHPRERASYNELASLGYYYSKINLFVNSAPHSSIYINALKHSVHRILTGYEDLVGSIEQGVNEGKDQDWGDTPLPYLKGLLAQYAIVLRDLHHFIVDHHLVKGGKLLTILYGKRTSGVPELNHLYYTLSEACHHVFYHQLTNWLSNGSLITDPFQEFFISTNPQTEKFEVVETNRPSWINNQLAHSILFMGRVVAAVYKLNQNEILTLHRLQVTQTLYELANTKTGRPIELELEVTLGQLRRDISANLWQKVFAQHLDLALNCQELRHHFLLGGGAQYTSLFNTWAHSLATHPDWEVALVELNQQFASHFPSTKYQLAQEKPMPGQPNFLWFISPQNPIILNYTLEWPLDLVLTDGDLTIYSQMFNYLAGIKFTHQALYRTVRPGRPPSWWGRLWPSKLLMLHVLEAIWGYLQVDVIQSNLTDLQQKLTDPQLAYDFESIQALHAKYLQTIHGACLLPFPKIAATLHDLLTSILNFTLLLAPLFQLGDAPPDPKDLLQLTKQSQEFIDTTTFLFRTLTSMNGIPTTTTTGPYLASVHRHLDRLLLRLDYNRWFSNAC